MRLRLVVPLVAAFALASVASDFSDVNLAPATVGSFTTDGGNTLHLTVSSIAATHFSVTAPSTAMQT